MPSSEVNSKIGVYFGNIVELKVDAIVNAAKTTLVGGMGVDGAIHAAAGPQLLQECLPKAPCQTGDAVITRGYRLPADYVIHAVGPIGENPALLASTYEAALERLADNRLHTIALPFHQHRLLRLRRRQGLPRRLRHCPTIPRHSPIRSQRKPSLLPPPIFLSQNRYYFGFRLRRSYSAFSMTACEGPTNTHCPSFSQLAVSLKCSQISRLIASMLLFHVYSKH